MGTVPPPIPYPLFVALLASSTAVHFATVVGDGLALWSPLSECPRHSTASTQAVTNRIPPCCIANGPATSLVLANICITCAPLPSGRALIGEHFVAYHNWNPLTHRFVGHPSRHFHMCPGSLLQQALTTSTWPGDGLVVHYIVVLYALGFGLHCALAFSRFPVSRVPDTWPAAETSTFFVDFDVTQTRYANPFGSPCPTSV